MAVQLHTISNKAININNEGMNIIVYRKHIKEIFIIFIYKTVLGDVIATNLRASLPLETEAESRWECLQGRCFSLGKQSRNSWFGVQFALGCLFLLLLPAIPYLFLSSGNVVTCWKPQGNESLECQAPAGVGWTDALIFVPRMFLPLPVPFSRLLPWLWVRVGCRSSPGMLSQHVPQPGCCSFQGKSGKDEREMRMLQLRSLQYLERYIFLILFNAYLHLEKKDSWQRPFSLWMREVRLCPAATSLSLVFTWEYRN